VKPLILLGFLFANQNYLEHVLLESGICAAKTGSRAVAGPGIPKMFGKKR